MIKTIVVDDEWYNMAEIVDLIEATGFMSVIKQYENGVKALEEIDQISPQVAFIDIEMPEIDGITLAEKLLEKNPAIIIVFITAWNQYAVQAFEINALDYIMKPVNSERFNKMVERIKSKINLKELKKGPSLEIKCFNKLDVSINGNKVIWQRTKAEELFAFLIMNNGNYVHKEIILEFLWPQYDRTKALPILQTSVCKIRNIFSALKNQVRIEYKDNKYGLFIKEVNYDYIEVENSISSYDKTDPKTFDAVERACKTFGMGFLTQSGYWWAIEKSEEIKKKLVKILKEILSFYTIPENAEKQLEVLELIVLLIPYEEEVYYRLFRTLESLDKYPEIVQKFKWLKSKLITEYDIVLSERLEKMYEKYK